jgi:UDP-N-acetylmuramoyl-L-alanyl-D-glutamate--2,6-diaminopimelate ligase
VIAIVDRREAIASALQRASKGDIVVIAGKGHETTQEIAGVVAPFDDVEVVQQILEDQEIVKNKARGAQ